MTLRLTTREATAAGWQLERTATGRPRMISPDGQRYQPTRDRAQAEVIIVPRTRGLLPLLLRRTMPPPPRNSA